MIREGLPLCVICGVGKVNFLKFFEREGAAKKFGVGWLNIMGSRMAKKNWGGMTTFKENYSKIFCGGWQNILGVGWQKKLG